MLKKEDIILEFMKSENYTPMKAKEMAIILGVPKNEYQEFTLILKELEDDYKITKNRKNRYRVMEDSFEEGTYRKNHPWKAKGI